MHDLPAPPPPPVEVQVFVWRARAPRRYWPGLYAARWAWKEKQADRYLLIPGETYTAHTKLRAFRKAARAARAALAERVSRDEALPITLTAQRDA